MVPKFRAVILSAVLITMMSIFAVVVSAPSLFSPSFQFNVNEYQIFLNHTNNFLSNITVGSNSSETLFLNISNASTSINPTYSQSKPNAVCGSDNKGFKLAVTNESGSHSVDIILDAGNSQDVSVYVTSTGLGCRPGRYSGGLTIQDFTNTTDKITFDVTIDIPITSSSSDFNSATGVGVYNGTLASQASTFHSYFFNTSRVRNATSLVVNLTAATDVDLFLFDENGVLIGKDVDRTDSVRSIISSFNSAEKFYEIRLYGNRTSSQTYSGVLVFSTLNIINTSDSNQKLDLIDFGTMQATNASSVGMTLINGGDIAYSNVKENSQISFVKRFGPENLTTADYEFLVPDFAKKIKVSVNWTREDGIPTTNYTLSLVAPNGTVVGNSSNKYLNANVSNAELEEFIETSDIKQGLWKLSVIATSPTPLNTYTAAAFVFFNSSDWISTNYTSLANKTFAATGSTNSSQNIELSLTVPNNTLDGDYEGFIEYAASNGAIVRSEIKTIVQAPTIVVENTLNSTSVTVDENIGANVTRSFDVTFNNTGSLDVEFDLLTSDNALKLTTNSSKFVNFSVETISSPIVAGENTSIRINLMPDTTKTLDTKGIYKGYLFINADQAHPYKGFNLTISLNLTDKLKTTVLDVINTTGSDARFLSSTAANQSITIQFNMTYINNTLVEGPTGFTTSNFSVYLASMNTSKRIPSSGSLTKSNASSAPVFDDVNDLFELNATIPSHIPGGYYSIHIEPTYIRTNSPQVTFTGDGALENFLLNNASMKMSSNVTGCNFNSETCSTSFSLSASNSRKIHVNATNFGPIAGSSITLNYSAESCSGYSVDTPTAVNCGSTSTSGTRITVSPTAFSKNCIVTWEVTAGSNSSSSCKGTIIGGPAELWLHPSAINISIEVSSSSETTTTTSSSSAAAAASTTSLTQPTYLDITTFPTLIEIKQGASKSSTVTVRNTNTSIDQTVTLKVLNLDASWFVVSPVSQAIAKSSTANYLVTFTVPNSSEVKDYTSQFVASSSQAEVTKDFTLRILPGEAAKSEINSTFESLSEEFLKFWKEFNSSSAAGLNLTSLEGKVLEIKSKLDQAGAEISKGTDDGYFQASQLLVSIKTLLDEAKSELTATKKEAGFLFSGNILLYAGIGAGIAAAAFLAYLFWPSKGEEGKKAKEKSQEVVRGMSSVKTRIQQKVHDKSEAFDRLKNIFRKRERKYRYTGE